MATGPNPSGLCMCGCGEPAPIAKSNDARYGIVKGLPQRYILGHQKYKSAEPYIIDGSGCWLWQRAVNSSGYGHLYVDGVHKYAHVHYYEMANGEVDNNGINLTSNQVHHKCGNKLCVNPDHLEVSNTLVHRREHGVCKITSTMALEIRDMAKRCDMTTREIGEMFGLSQSHVSGIKNGHFWKHI